MFSHPKKVFMFWSWNKIEMLREQESKFYNVREIVSRRIRKIAMNG